MSTPVKTEHPYKKGRIKGTAVSNIAAPYGSPFIKPHMVKSEHLFTLRFLQNFFVLKYKHPVNTISKSNINNAIILGEHVHPVIKTLIVTITEEYI